MVEFVILNVVIGVSENLFDVGGQISFYFGKVFVVFVKFVECDGKLSKVYFDKICEVVKGIQGVEIFVDQEQNGFFIGKLINIEIVVDDFDFLVVIVDEVK